MKHKHYTLYLWLLVVLGLFFRGDAKPFNSLPACLSQGCNEEMLSSGPVCGIDDSGLPRTFDSRCMAKIEFCTYGIYFAEVKPGEC